MLLNRSPIEIGFLEFHNQRQTLANGTYRVTEADGDINYALIDGDIKWYSEREFDEAVLEQGRMDYLDQQLMFDPEDDEDLMDSWTDAMHRDHDEHRRVDARDFANDDDREADEHLVVEMSAPGKTLGELLRESMATPDSAISPLVLDSDGHYRESTQVEYDAAMARRNMPVPEVTTRTPMFNERPFIEADDMAEAEYENHRQDLSSFMERSSEQLDRSMTNKTADLGDLL